MEPCPQNNQSDLGAVTLGKVFAKDNNEVCAQITDTNADLTNYSKNELNNILNDMMTKSALSAADTAFITNDPIATIPILKLAIATNTTSETIGNLSDLTAKAFALQMLYDLYNRTDGITRKAKEILTRQNGAASGQKDTKCAAATFAPNIDKNLTVMMEAIQKVRNGAQASYNTSATQFANSMQYLQQQQQQEAYVNSLVRKRFGDYAANAVGKKMVN